MRNDALRFTDDDIAWLTGEASDDTPRSGGGSAPTEPPTPPRETLPETSRIDRFAGTDPVAARGEGNRYDEVRHERPSFMQQLTGSFEGATSLLGLDFDTAMAVAGWQYEVEKVPAHGAFISATEAAQAERLQHVPESSFEEAEGCFLLGRTDDRTYTGMAGSRYTPVQNSVVMDQVRPLVERGTLQLVTGGIWKGGQTAYLLGDFDKGMLVEEATRRFDPRSVERMEKMLQGMRPWIYFRMDHSGMGSNMMLQLPYRIACTNQLPGIMTERGVHAACKIRHTASGPEGMLHESKRILGQMVERYIMYAAQQEALQNQTVPVQVFERLVLDAVLPLKKPREDETPRQRTLREQQVEKRALVSRLRTEGAGHVGDDSAWEALNAYVEAVDNGYEGFTSRVRNGTDGLIRSRLDGTFMDAKRTVARNLFRYSTEAGFRRRIDRELAEVTVR
jgi:hypothetical protein